MPLIHTNETLDKAKQALIDAGCNELFVSETVIPTLLNKGFVIREVSDEQLEAGYPLTLEALIFTALGEASMCWSPNTGDAEFDCYEASKIGALLLNRLRARGAR